MRFFYGIQRAFRSRWLRIPLIILGLLALFTAIWFGFPMTGWAIMSTIWLRATVIGLIFSVFVLVWFIRWRRRRRAAAELEEALIPPEPVGDGKVLAERMSAALTTLKSSGGRTYLYDLPWYVIIGPPGAGKTTALANSGIEFPLADGDAGTIQGFGGTRNCDWWFAEDAILIDTAGRYTTQDSDRDADEASWKAFLGLLKKGRAKQPINGVILAFSVQDMMTASQDELAAQATTVRTRLAEIHETLRIDFPVYVLFTKADLISGFREYFSSFRQNRRQAVWGTTFQTKDRSAQTFKEVGAEFDMLVARLSDEIIDRMSEEADGINRIAIFGLPGQMGLMRENVTDFLRRIFEPTRYKTNAILRGFYFTSGTQEGTPIDQVLGAMSRQDGASAAFQPSFMSGQGKSFFLHDLLRNVIFAERDWVSHDERAVRWSLILRTAGLVLIGAVTFGMFGALGYSYWQNASLVRTANAEAGDYERSAQVEINREVVDDTDLEPVLPHLQNLRDMSVGFGSVKEPPWPERFGLSQRGRLELAAVRSYSDALERMLRPRLILELERELPRLIASEDTSGIYQTLKVYMLLGGQGEKSDDEAIKLYFADKWRAAFSGFDGLSKREQLEAHLTAMLELDDARNLLVAIDENTVIEAQEAIVQLPLAEQAYTTIKNRIDRSGLPDFNLAERTGPSSSYVFQRRGGQDFSELSVNALFTFEGYWTHFLNELETAEKQLKDDQWVLGAAAERVDFDRQIQGLERRLHTLYKRDFAEAWDKMFAQLAMAPLSSGAPSYDALGRAAAPTASPILELVEAVTKETRLTTQFEAFANMTPEMLATGGTDEASKAIVNRFRSQGGFARRLIMDTLAGGKNQSRPGGSGAAPDSAKRQVELIEEPFEAWHKLLEGQEGGRPIDALLKSFKELRDNRRISGSSPQASDAILPSLLSSLTSNNSRLPATLAGLVNEVEAQFRADAQNASMAEMNRALNDDVALFCLQDVKPLFPHSASDRHIAPNVFGEFFGPGGRMDAYFTQYLQPHVSRTPSGLVPRPNSDVAARISASTLRQFERAEAIRKAFFAGGSSTPDVEFFVTHVSGQGIEEANLKINSQEFRSGRGETSSNFNWPGQGSAVELAFWPSIDGNANARRWNGRWSIRSFIQEAQSQDQNGNVLRLTHRMGSRAITLKLEFNSTTVPFTMRELSDFSCPVSVD